MRLRTSPAELLLKIPRQTSPADQEASFRQALTALAQTAGAMGPSEFDGFDPRALEGAAHLAMERGWADRLDWIAPGSAAVALYEVSSALPAGSIKRDLRRRVFSLLYEGSASAFVPVATRIALGSAAPLSTPTLRARIALAVDLPIGTTVNVAPLALALTTRSGLQDTWIDAASMGALPSRRLAAQLFEHAAREAIFRFQLGDPQPRNLLLGPQSRVFLERLLKDREPLVWRHAAVARGLLAAIHPEVRDEVEQSMDPTLSITEWRRGAVSLVASTVLGDEEAHRSVHAIMKGPVAEKDSGLLSTLVLGLPRVVELEPDRAEDILDRLAATRRPDVAAAVAELIGQLRDPGFAPAACAILRDALAEAAKKQSLAERSLVSRALRQLGRIDPDDPDLTTRVQRGLLAFENDGARQAFEEAQKALVEAHEIADFVEANDPVDQISLSAAVGGLVDLDTGVFERPLLGNLLLLARRPGDPDGVVGPLERLQNRTSQWILDGVEKSGRVQWSRDGALADQRRLRVLLHLVDAEASGGEGVERPLGTRLQRAIRVLIERLEEGPDASVHRVLCAALARSLDAAAREQVVQTSDIVLVIARILTDHFSVQTIAEASTSPDVSGPMGALARFMTPDLLDPGSETTDSSLTVHFNSERPAEDGADSLRLVGRVLRFSQELAGDGGYQSEALRRVVFRLGRALESIATARGQTELVEPRESGGAVLEELSLAVEDLEKMIRSAERRVLGDGHGRISGNYDDLQIADVIERGVAAGVPASADEVAHSIEGLVRSLPPALAQIVEQITFGIHQLPLESRSESSPVPLAQRRAPLPDWLLPRRSVGSFLVLRPLGSGGVSSVFVARRMEERNNQKAENFALKVPEYDPSTARSMSEKEFFQMFREEAGALLSLPSHENLARFVTFDLAARPKPILVMELIRGTALDRLIRSQSLSMPRVIAYLDGILAGLEAMHAAGLGHLDVKPSNVILRGGRTPVLVDFGLSGRKLRPGCGTIEYTAPEVLGVVPADYEATPPPADIYAFGCLMYEMLTGELLFDAPDELALVAKHVSHDGWMPPLETLAEQPKFFPVARLIGGCLRHDPRDRPTASDLRHEVTNALVAVADAPWPARRRQAVG